jgi:hypothetical protein
MLQIKENILKSQDSQKMKYNKRQQKGVKVFTFKAGDQVLRKNTRKLGRKGSRLEQDWLGPYIIQQVLKSTVVLEKDGKSLQTKVSHNQIKPYISRISSDTTPSPPLSPVLSPTSPSPSPALPPQKRKLQVKTTDGIKK